MNDLGTPSAPQRLGEPSQDDWEIPLRLLIGAVAVMLILAGITGWVLTRPDKADAGASYPSSWDARIAPYVKKTERLRGLMFLHPVKVTFLPANEFKKTLEADESELSDEDRQDMENMTGVLRAVGLIKGNPDLFKAGNDFSTNGTLAYYSFADQTITIRGKRITPSVRSTVVHELTHALQDQHFSIGDRMKELTQDPDGPSTTESDVLDAVIEGDAERVQTLYRNSLSVKQRKALDASSQNEYDDAEPALAHMPKILLTMATSSYTLGEALVATAATEGGNSKVDDLFRDTPKHDLALLDPFTVLEGNAEPAAIDIPTLKDGEEELDSGDFGVTMWYLMLAERLPINDALAAADGWGGDGFLAYQTADGSDCARATLTGAGKQDTQRLYTALQRWIAAAPGSPAEVTKAGSRIRFQSCDPGKRARIGRDASQRAVSLATTRTYLGIILVKAGVPADVSRCTAGKMVRAYSGPQLDSMVTGPSDPVDQARIAGFAATCRSQLG